MKILDDYLNDPDLFLVYTSKTGLTNEVWYNFIDLKGSYCIYVFKADATKNGYFLKDIEFDTFLRNYRYCVESDYIIDQCAELEK